MGGAASKIKGSSAERELAKLFSTVFNGSFIRSAASGGYVGGKNGTRKAHLSDGQIRNAKGDLVPPDFMPRFVVEVKSYDAFRFHQLLAANCCPQLDAWIAQTLDCIDPGDTWFIAYKINRLGWFVAVPETNHGYQFDNHCVYQGSRAKVRITELRDFFIKNRDLIMRHSV